MIAYAALSDAHTLLAVFGGRPSLEMLPIARGYAEKAIELDVDLADSHWARGHVAMTLEFDNARAIPEFERALAIDPGHVDARHLYSILLTLQRRFEEAEEHLTRTLATNPLHATASMTLGQVYNYTGRHERGIQALRAALELVPELYYAREQLAHSFIQTGRYDEALAECERAASTGGARGSALLAYALAVVGRTQDARLMADHLLSADRVYQPPVHIAMVLTALGDTDSALTWLERGFAERDPHFVGSYFRYEFQRLHGEPRFEALVRQSMAR